ncbi:MAG TPA: sigma-70 family RNA polymerase sigma factor [Acidimicrobiales bacterium]|nr:sigma-70 family RNA polymerase sigma factor [Acidimicrobiales bacterium]
MTDVAVTAEVAALEGWLEEGYTTSFRTACLILGNRADAEEAVQEAYLRAWRFRDSLPTGVDGRRWLFRVVVNTCNSKLRKEIPHRDRRARDEALDTVASVRDPMGDATVAHDVVAALQDLPIQLRVVVVLRYYADLSEREIATAIGRPAGTVKSRLHEARRLLAAHPSLTDGALDHTTIDSEVRS